MKLNNSLKWLALAAAVLGLVLVSCNKEPKEKEPGTDGDDVVLTTQAQVDGFKARKTMNSLTIKGEDITDISAINVTTLETLIIDGTGIEDLVNDTFTSVNKDLKIVNNAKLKSISKLGLKFCTAEVLIQNNPLLDCIKGFQNLKKMSGNLTIKDNASLGADDGDAGDEYGFNVIKKLIDNQVLTVNQVTLSNNHPDAVTDASLIGCGGSGIPSYTIRTVGDLAGITKTECQDLKILGPDIDNEVWSLIKSTGLKTVHGDLYCEGCNFSMCSNFFEKNGEGVKVEGGITFKNFVAYQENNKSMYINADNIPAHIGGDLVLEKLWIHGWAGAGFNAITEIDGDFIVMDCHTDNNCFGKLLTKVHGNVVIDGLLPGYNGGEKGPWNLDMGIEEIDGNLTITNNGWLTNLVGWTHVKKIGGKLTIKNNFWKGFESGEPDSFNAGKGTGWDLVQQWIYDGVVDIDKVECYNTDGSKVEFKASAPKDIVITSQADIDALTAPEGELLVAKSLTVKGSGVTNDVWASIKTKIGTVQGDLVCEDAAFTMLGNFFPGADGKGVVCQGNITFRNIACGAGQYLNSDNFPTVVPGNLTLDNVNIHGWAGAGFNLVTEVNGDLFIKTAVMGNNTCFTALKKVAGNLTIDGPQADFNGQRIWNVSDWTITQIGGTLSLKNTKIVNFDGFGNLIKLGGLYVKDTEIEDFTQVRTWLTSEVVKSSNVECYDKSGKLVDFSAQQQEGLVYPDNASIFTGHDAIVALMDGGRKDYDYLVLDGNNETITDSEMADLKLAFDKVANIVFINIKGFSMLEQLFPGGDFTVTPTGSIYIINCPDMYNINGLKWLTKINGDLVFEDCPKIAWNWGAGNCCNQITEITGNFTVKNSAAALTGATCLASLQKVGGNLTISGNCVGFWDLDGMPLKEIGGNFTYTNNELVNSFKGFTGLTKIGGNLVVKGNAIEDFSQVQSWISGGVLKGTAECYNKSGQKITFE